MEFSAVKAVQRRGGKPEATSLGVFPSLESAMRAVLADPDIAHMTAVSDWDPSDDPPGIRRAYRSDASQMTLALVGIHPVPEKPAAAPLPRRPSKPQGAKGRQERLWIVQSGRSQTLHLMHSKTPKINSAGENVFKEFTAPFFGVPQTKFTLCGKPATRHVEVFAPSEVTCRECKRRAGFG